MLASRYPKGHAAFAFTFRRPFNTVQAGRPSVSTISILRLAFAHDRADRSFMLVGVLAPTSKLKSFANPAGHLLLTKTLTPTRDMSAVPAGKNLSRYNYRRPRRVTDR